MFRFRFEAITRLRENERDAARASLAEAIEAMRQIELRRKELADERTALDRESERRRTGTLSIDRLLSDGRYERQLAADDHQVVEAGKRIEAELLRRQAIVAEANAGVRQMELLKERELSAWNSAHEKIEQANLDEVAARGQRARQLIGESIFSPMVIHDGELK
jgi:flagellar export protein FliJ